MQEFLIYLIKTSALLSLFYLVYAILLRKDTSFITNRRFLIAGIFSAAVLPAISFTRKIPLEPVSSFSTTEMLESSTNQATSTLNLWEVAGGIYLLVSFTLLVRLSLQLFWVLRFIFNHTHHQNQGYTLINTPKEVTPFSFFRYIIYNPELHSKKELELILCHENVHARQRHSLDILLGNLITVLLWFNPLSWLYKKCIEQNLEFIADRETVITSGEKTAYQHTLVKITTGGFSPAITNQFYQSLIKKRILMLNKNQKNQAKSWKMMLLFPLILAFMLTFNVKTEARILPSENQKSNIVTEEYQQILEAHFSENTTKEDLERYKSHFAEKGVELEWDLVEFTGNKLKKIKITYTWETGDSRQFISETDENNKLIPFKLGSKFHENGKIAFITIANKRPGEKTEEQLVEKEAESTEKQLPENLVYKIDGQEVEKEALDKLDPEIIAEMRVLKDKKAIEEAGEKGKDGVILIETKKPGAKEKEKSHSYRKKSGITITKPDKQHVNLSHPEDINAYQPTIRQLNMEEGERAKRHFFHKSTIDQKPLIIVDGKQKPSSYNIEEIESSEIERINVIKGASATKKYGEKGNHGVIEITLKKD